MAYEKREEDRGRSETGRRCGSTATCRERERAAEQKRGYVARSSTEREGRVGVREVKKRGKRVKRKEKAGER